MATPNSGVFVGDPVLSKKPPQERPDNGRSAAFFMATYDGNPISIINEGNSNMAGRSNLQATRPLLLLLPKPRWEQCLFCSKPQSTNPLELLSAYLLASILIGYQLCGLRKGPGHMQAGAWRAQSAITSLKHGRLSIVID